MLTGKIRADLDSFFFADGLAYKTVFAVLKIFEDRFFSFFIPANDIDKASLVAQLAADAFFSVELDLMVRVDHINPSYLLDGNAAKLPVYRFKFPVIPYAFL
jgi:hypothetical protein